MKRTKLADRQLPGYSRGEELTNTITHIFGAVLALAALVACVIRASLGGNPYSIVSGAVYGTVCFAMFTVSSVYHGLNPSMGKKVMQVIDHCTIYALIAGTYTPVVLCALRPAYPVLGWGLFFFQWGLALAATVVTAIDLHRYSAFSMCCYIGMGWAVLPFWRQTLAVMGRSGFLFLRCGGVAYTIGAVLFALGSRRKWMHSAFHVFVVLGAALQAAAIFFWAI